MTIFVVRHASAGRKKDWRGDDGLRPLDAYGRRQAEDIADLLAARHPRRLLSSPTRRCLDTLAPLARRLDLPVLGDDRLRVDSGHPGLLFLLEHEAEPGDVLCTHGELMSPALDGLARRSAVGHDDPGALLAKGCVWAVERDQTSLALLGRAPARVGAA